MRSLRHPAKHFFVVRLDWIRLTVWPFLLKWFVRPIVLNAGFWTAAATVAIAIATVIYTHYSKKQWQAMDTQAAYMKNQWNDMEAQLGEMKKQNTLTKEQLEGTMSAVLKINMAIQIDPLRTEAQINLMNVGHVVAKNVRVNLAVTRKMWPTNTPVGTPIPVEYAVPEIGLTQDMWQTREYPFSLSSAERREVAEGRLIVRLEGNLTYYDGFETQTYPICYANLTYEIRDKTGKVVQSGNNPQVPCDEFDVEIQGIFRQKREWAQKIWGQKQ